MGRLHRGSRLPEAEAALVRRVDLEGTPIEQIVRELGRPRTSVARQLDRAREKLADLARASERAAGLGLRRRPATEGQPSRPLP